MNVQPPLISQPPKRTGWIVFSVIVTFILVISVFANFALLAMLSGMGHSPTGALESRHNKYFEEYVQGDEDAHSKIAVISLSGVISSAQEGSLAEGGMVREITDQLQQAVDDHRVKAIVLHINSPGGEVVASDAIYRALVNARKSKPVVAFIETVGASGAYYAAMGTSYVMATDMSITGSIGVIMQSFTVAGLMEKVGVKSYTFKSGLYKDILNPTREPTEDEKKLVSTLIMEVYDKFVGIVAKERKMDVDDLKNGLADGRIFSGKQAFDTHFIDGIGYLDDAIDKAKKLGGNLKEAKVIRYSRPVSLRRLLRLFGESEQTKLQIQIAPLSLKLESGKLYFLPAYMFQ